MDSNQPLNLTASAQVKTGAGILVGMYVNSTSSGTIRFNDGTSGTPAAGTKATAVFTASGALSNGETVTVGNKVYTFKTTINNANPNEVLLGANTAAALDNLKSAVNKDTGAGTTYSSTTEAHTQVIATTNTDTAQTFESLSVGVYANSIATTETCANASFAGATMSGGVDTNTTINNTITPAVGYHDLGNASFTNGLYATIANTLNVTLYYKPM